MNNNSASVVILNTIGLVVAVWGVIMLMDNHPIFIPTVVNSITLTGLGFILVATVLHAKHTFPQFSLVSLPLIALTYIPKVKLSRKNKHSSHGVYLEPEDSKSEYSNLWDALDELSSSARELIEKKRELYYLNVHQWHNEHKEETQSEIFAAKRYRSAKSTILQEKSLAPSQFLIPINSFCDALEDCLSEDIYSSPGDRHVKDKINDLLGSTNNQIVAAARLISN
jgi:hypothetical protein